MRCQFGIQGKMDCGSLHLGAADKKTASEIQGLRDIFWGRSIRKEDLESQRLCPLWVSIQQLTREVVAQEDKIRKATDKAE